jgi:peptide/nickel transport system substrate-binding protein
MTRKIITIGIVFILIAMIVHTPIFAKERTDLNFGLYGEPTTLDPHDAGDDCTRTLVYQIHDYLLREQQDKTLGSALAESWEFSDSGTEITFYLREDVKFHNGDIVSAEDVAFSLNKAIASSFSSRVTSAMDSAEVIDENKVVLKLKYPFGPALQCLATANMGILNKNAYEADPEYYKRNPIGCGPYVFVEWKSGEEIRLKAFEDYYKGPAPIKDILVRIQPDPNTRVVSLEKGETDFTIIVPVEDRAHIDKNPNLVLYPYEGTAVTCIRFNNKDEVFSDKRVRQAIAHCIDKEALILGAEDGYAVPLETPMTKAAFGWPADFKNREYDLDKAKALLAEAGYPDGLKATITTSELEDYRKRAEILQDQFKAIGVEAEIDSLEWGAYIDRTLTQRDYQITSLNMTVPYLDADHIYELFHSEMITKGRNFVLVENEELDDLLDRARASIDQEERKELYAQIAELWKEEVITIPLYVSAMAEAAHKDLKGIVPDRIITEYNLSYFYWE